MLTTCLALLTPSTAERLSIVPKTAQGRDGIHPQVTAGSAVKRDQLKREGRYRATPDCTGNSQPLTSGTMHFPCLSWCGHICFPSSSQQRNCVQIRPEPGIGKRCWARREKQDRRKLSGFPTPSLNHLTSAKGHSLPGHDHASCSTPLFHLVLPCDNPGGLIGVPPV